MKEHWSCSKLADWLRGTKKPTSASLEGWNEWHKIAKQKKFRYWLVEEFFDRVEDVIFWPANRINNIRCYINNRWFIKTHALTSNLKRGEWHEYDTRLLHAVFDGLINFVEIEKAWKHYICLSKKDRKKYKMPWYRKLFRIGSWRCPEAGIDYLDWEAMLKNDEDWLDKNDPEFGNPTPQALGAIETLKLYTWWKIDRPKRLDPMEVSGLSAYYDEKNQEAKEKGEDSLMNLFGENRTKDERFEGLSNTYHQMEQQQEDEDTEMLMRLIKIRHHLWT